MKPFQAARKSNAVTFRPPERASFATGPYEDVKAIIRMLKAEGKTIFLTSHHFKDIEQLCDQVYSIEDCRLIPITEEIAARYREMD